MVYAATVATTTTTTVTTGQDDDDNENSFIIDQPSTTEHLTAAGFCYVFPLFKQGMSKLFDYCLLVCSIIDFTVNN